MKSIVASAVVIVFTALRPGVSGAQPSDAEGDRPHVAGPTSSPSSLRDLTRKAVIPIGLFQQKPVPKKPVPPPPPVVVYQAQRKPTYVGYLDDAFVRSRVRIRFEQGFNADVPDRAEFFYAKCGCYKNEVLGEAFDPDAPGPGPGLGAANDVNFQQVYLFAEAAAGRISMFGELPVRWVQAQSTIPGTGDPFEDAGGLSDIRVGLRYGLVDTPERVLTAQAQFYLPSGSAEKGLGTNHGTLEGSGLIYQEVTPKVSIEGQLGIWIPLGGSNPVPTHADGSFSGPVLFYGVGPSMEVYRRGNLTLGPVVEVVIWHVLGGFQTGPADGDASGITIANIKLGGRIGWGTRGSIYVGYGKALTDSKWYSDLFRLEYRHTF